VTKEIDMTLHISKKRRTRISASAIIGASLAALALGGCDASVDATDTQAGAIAHARANGELRERLEALSKAGWATEPVADSGVERFQVPAGAEPATTPGGTWTRVHFPVVLPATGDRPEARADVLVAWPDQGADVVAIAPRDAAAADALADALPSGEPAAAEIPSEAETMSELETTTSALSCGRNIGEGCSSTLRCCRGLACTAYSYYSTCTCPSQVTVNYPERATTSVACFNLWDNPIGAAKIQRYVRGCTAGGAWNLSANACGNAVSTPGFQTSTWTQLICLFTPGPIC